MHVEDCVPFRSSHVQQGLQSDATVRLMEVVESVDFRQASVKSAHCFLIEHVGCSAPFVLDSVTVNHYRHPSNPLKFVLNFVSDPSFRYYLADYLLIAV